MVAGNDEGALVALDALPAFGLGSVVRSAE